MPADNFIFTAWLNRPQCSGLIGLSSKGAAVAAIDKLLRSIRGVSFILVLDVRRN